MQDTLDPSISTRTISHKLVSNGLYSYCPVRRLPLTPVNRRHRLEWCRARSTWMTEWHRVVFSTQSRFCLSSDSRREVPNALYQQYKARPYTARISQQTLQDVQMLPWPPYSPDLSPIEYVCRTLLNAVCNPCLSRTILERMDQQRKYATSGRQRSTKGNNRMGGQSNCQNGCRTAPESTLSTIQRVIGTQVSKMTINRRLRERNLRARRPLRCLPLTSVHRQVQLQWCRERSTWNCADWGRIVFSDESRFLLSCGSWPYFQTPHRSTTGRYGLKGISFDSRTPLVVIPGTLTAQRYVDDILRPGLLPFLSHHPGLTFQQDNARPHTARVTMDCLQSCRTLSWPARSPDLMLIEHIWDVMGRRLQSSRHVDYLARQNAGAARVTSARVDRRILRQAVADPHSTCFFHSAKCARHSISFHHDQNHFPSNPAAFLERPITRQRGIIVWGAIVYDTRSHLVRIQGTMTAQRYVDDVLPPVTLPYLQGPEDELWQMVEREWRAIPQDAIGSLIDSLPRRVAVCIATMLAKVDQQRKNATSGRQRSTKGHNRTGGQSNCQNGSRSTGIHVIYHPTCDRHTSVQNDHQQAHERAESKSSPTVTMPTPHTRAPTSPTTVVSGAINLELRGRIVFSDESRFLLCPDDRRKRVWRRPGQRVDPGLTVEHHTGPQQGVMVWDVILFDSRTSLEVIPDILTAQRYVDNILRPVLLPFLSHHSGRTFKQDNAWSHTARVTMDCLQSSRTLLWPARSPDLSPIEHIWDVMVRRLQPSRNVDYLARQLETI
ncbi:hypothetical protein LAZ67_16000812 [Cordylochernes scorpioides]|uniref:Transposase n=1 Tax=Cordylochernes scorpioides TaxID=51811 RepID=A0ABY6LEE6_9ARAC|nr:hypothetical protein LAZ67_16000812 [Cordylochernes scorpioides]